MTKSLTFLRHGRTDWNATGRWQGHTDVPLNAEGRAQAEAVAPVLSAVGFARVWSSDLSRALETAKIAVGGPITLDARLRELGLGEAEGLTAAEVRERYPHLVDRVVLSAVADGVPGAETHAELVARSVPAVEEAFDELGPGEQGLVVAHGGVIKAAVGGILGWPQEASATLLTLGNCHTATLELRAGSVLRLVSYGIHPISHP